MSSVWFLSMERPGLRAEWDCATTLGTPDPRDLLPTRRPASGDFSRHIPRRAHAATTGGAMEVESGLEHDLLRWLDLRTDVHWLVSQPVQFHFSIPERRRPVIHTPDFLSRHDDGSVVLWDVRPDQRRSADFLLKVGLTADECRAVGWRHEVFSGLPTPVRMNLLWLNGYRCSLPWHAPRRDEIKAPVIRSRGVRRSRSRCHPRPGLRRCGRRA